MPDLLQPDIPGAAYTRRLAVRRHLPGNNMCGMCCVEQLMGQATLFRPAFEVVFNRLARYTQAFPGQVVQWKKAYRMVGGNRVYRFRGHDGRHHILIPEMTTVSRMGPNKKAPRIEQKCNTKYRLRARAARRSPARYINDAVRGSLVFRNANQMLRAVQTVERWENSRFNYGNEEVWYEVWRAKQIFRPRSALVYGDIKMNLRVKTSTNPHGHNCELQIHNLHMIIGKGKPSGHGAYVTWRDLDDLHWQQRNEAMPVALVDMDNWYAGRARRAVHASHDAYTGAARRLDADNDYATLLDYVDNIRGR